MDDRTKEGAPAPSGVSPTEEKPRQRPKVVGAGNVPLGTGYAAPPKKPERRSLLGELLAAFQPNQSVTSGAMRLIIAVQVVLALLVWLNSPFKVLPRPDEVWQALQTLWMAEGLGPELFASFKTNLEALAISTALSMLLSYLTVLPFFRPLVGAITKGRFLSLVGFSFIFTLVFGGGHPLKVSLLVFGMCVFFVTSMAAVIALIPRSEFDYARTLRMGEWRVVWEVVVLGTVDEAFEVLRQNAAIGWMMLTMVEGISRSEGGVGAMLLNQSKHFHLAQVFAIQILILTVGLIQDFAIGLAGRVACPYAHLTLERK
jgi:NitT/TauT family transport system permease protein